MIDGDNMMQQHQAQNSLYDLKIQSLSQLRRYGKHYMQYLLGAHKSNLINHLRKQLKIFPSELIDAIELLAERNVQYRFKHQDLNLYEHNMFVNRCQHINNKKYWNITSFRLAKDDLSPFFHYLKTHIQNLRHNHCPHPNDNIDKKSSRLLAFRLAMETVNTYFKAVDNMPPIQEVDLFQYRLTICAWEIAYMFLKVKTGGISSLNSHFDGIKITEKDNLATFWQSAINIIVDQRDLVGISMKLEFLYIDFLKDTNTDNTKLAFFIKTALPLVPANNISHFINICNGILAKKSTEELYSYFQEAGLLNIQ